MNREHYRYIIDHFRLNCYLGYNHIVFNLITGLYITTINKDRYMIRAFIEHDYDGMNIWIFDNIPALVLAEEIIQHIEDTKILFI